MAKKYLGQDEYPYNQPGDVRVIFKIEPQRLHYGNQAPSARAPATARSRPPATRRPLVVHARQVRAVKQSRDRAVSIRYPCPTDLLEA